MLLSIPKRFYDDHVERDLPAPEILERNGQHYTIDSEHPDFDELVNDASHYADVNGPRGNMAIVMAARALCMAIAKQR